MDKVIWDFNTMHIRGTQTNVFEEGYVWAFDEIKKATGGRFEGVIHERSALGIKSSETCDAVAQRIVPISEMYPSHVSWKYPWTQVLEMPFLYDAHDLILIDRLWDGLWGDFTGELEKDGLVFLAGSCEPFGRGFVVNKPLNPDPEAILKGMRIRVNGPITGWAVDLLGGTPVPLTGSWAEILGAARNGDIDGMDAPILTFNVFGLKAYEFFKYALVVHETDLRPQLQLGTTSWTVVANKSMFESLPPDMGEIIKDSFKKAGRRWIRTMDWETPIRLATEKYGMEIQRVKPETIQYLRSKAPEFWASWRKKAGSIGGHLLDNAIAMIAG